MKEFKGIPLRKVLFAYHRYRNLDTKQRLTPWNIDFPSLYGNIAPDYCASHYFDDSVRAGENVDEAFFRACSQIDPELVIFYPIQHDSATSVQPSNSMLRKIRDELGIPVFAYLGDAWFQDQRMEEMAREWSESCHRLIICDPGSPWFDSGWSEGKLVRSWFARDPMVFRPGLGQRDIEVGFLGSIEQYPERKAILDELLSHGVKVLQKGGVSKGVFLPIEELALLFGRTYISINFTTIPELPGVLHCRGRVWESILSGCLLFEESGSETECFFEPGKHYISYENLDDLVEKVYHYLEHRAEGEAIANAGLAEARTKYSRANLLKNIFSELSDLK